MFGAPGMPYNGFVTSNSRHLCRGLSAVFSSLLGRAEAQERGIFRQRRKESRATRHPICRQDSTLRFLLVHRPFAWSVLVQMANPGKGFFQAVLGAFPDPLVGFHVARGLVIPGDGLLAVRGPVLEVAQ